MGTSICIFLGSSIGKILIKRTYFSTWFVKPKAINDFFPCKEPTTVHEYIQSSCAERTPILNRKTTVSPQLNPTLTQKTHLEKLSRWNSKKQKMMPWHHKSITSSTYLWKFFCFSFFPNKYHNNGQLSVCFLIPPSAQISSTNNQLTCCKKRSIYHFS